MLWQLILYTEKKEPVLKLNVRHLNIHIIIILHLI